MDPTDFNRLVSALPRLPPSPFSQYFETNYMPTDDQVSDIRALVKSPRKRLELLDEQLKILGGYREELSQYIDKHDTLASPIRRVPDDILGAVFIAALPHAPTFIATEPPHTLTWVCRRWREVALSTPRLWSNVLVHMPFNFLTPDSARLIALRCSALQTWLERSKSTPLRVWIVDTPDNAVRKALQPFTHRIEVARQALNDLNRDSFLINEGHFPKLRFIAAECRSRQDALVALYDPNFLARAPNVEGINIRGGWSSPLKFALNWSRMTYFRWKPWVEHAWLSTDQTLKLLESMPSLGACHIDQTEGRAQDTYQDAQNWRHVGLPRLESLLLHQIEGGPMTVDIFRYIDAPILHDLSFSYSQPVSLQAPAIRTQTLRRLEVYVEHYPNQELINLLSSVDSVEELSLTYRPYWTRPRAQPDQMPDEEWDRMHGFNDRVLKGLMAMEHGPSAKRPCPRLRSLEINDLEGGELAHIITTEVFMAFIVHRNTNVEVESHRLARIRLLYPGYVPGLEDALGAWNKAGNPQVRLEFTRDWARPQKAQYPQVPPSSEVVDW